MIFRLLQLRVVNRPGVMNRITQVVLKPGYNIDTLSLNTTDNSDVSIITLGIRFKDIEATKLLAKQLEKQIDIYYARDITEGTQFEK